MTNYELFKNIVKETNLDRILGIAAEEVFAAIPEPEGVRMKEKIQAATNVIIPVIVPIYKDSFLEVYKSEFSDDEFGQLLGFYGPGSVLWSFFNTEGFFSWLRTTVRECIQSRIKGLELQNLQSLARISLNEILDQLPEWVKISSDYLGSDLCRREATLGEKIAKEGNKRIAEVKWYDILEKSGILPNED